MTVSFMILLAIVWGIFGLWGFLRGWKSALVMLVMIIGSLLLLSIAPERVAKMFDYINKAVAMVTGGSKPLINTAPSSLVVIILNGAVFLGFLLGLLRIFRTKPSFSGFLLGFINGYFYTAYMLAALVPQWAILPLPIKIPGLQAVSLSSAIAAPPSEGLPGAIVDGLATLCTAPCLPTVIVAGIFLFILLTILLGNRGGRGGKKE
jgi:hypothetical protein